jgi:hypothetical protein
VTLRQLWAKHRLKLHEFQTLERGSELYDHLVSSGISSRQLDGYIGCGRGRKREGCTPPADSATIHQVAELVRLGGSVSGGAALRSWLYLDDARDYDLFFRDMPSFVKAHLAVYDNPLIDVCLYDDKPYELFDLAACKCSYSSAGFDISPDFDQAMSTGISDIELGAIVHPLATLRRIAKYGEKYNLRFPLQKVILLATTSSGDKSVVSRALRYAVT